MAAALGWGALAASSLVLGMLLGLAAGAIVYFVAARLVEHIGPGDASGGMALALGAFLDGIPEQTVLGIGFASGQGVSVALLVAIFVSNLPEAIGASTELRAAGRHPRTIRRLWAVVALVCTAAGVAGALLADATSGDAQAVINGFAAGALLVMLVDSMIPDARRKSGRPAGLVTVLGFAVAAGLAGIS